MNNQTTDGRQIDPSIMFVDPDDTESLFVHACIMIGTTLNTSKIICKHHDTSFLVWDNTKLTIDVELSEAECEEAESAFGEYLKPLIRDMLQHAPRIITFVAYGKTVFGYECIIRTLEFVKDDHAFITRDRDYTGKVFDIQQQPHLRFTQGTAHIDG